MTSQLPEVQLTPEQEERAWKLYQCYQDGNPYDGMKDFARLIVHLQDRVKQLEDENIMRFDQARHFAELAAGRAQPPGDSPAEKALRNCLLLAMRNLHVKHPDSLAAKNWEAVLRFCKEGGVEPSPLRSETTEGAPK